MDSDTSKYTSHKYNLFRQKLVTFTDLMMKELLDGKPKQMDKSLSTGYDTGKYVPLRNYKNKSEYIHYVCTRQDKGIRVFPSINRDEYQYGVYTIQIGLTRRKVDCCIQVPLTSREHRIPVSHSIEANHVWGLEVGDRQDFVYRRSNHIVQLDGRCTDDGDAGHVVRKAVGEAASRYKTVETRLSCAKIIIDSCDGNIGKIDATLKHRPAETISTDELLDIAEMITFSEEREPKHWIKRAYSRGTEIIRRREDEQHNSQVV